MKFATFFLKNLKKRRMKDFVDGFQETKEKVGLIVRQESLVEDKKEKIEEVIQHVAQQWQCVIRGRNTKKALKEFLGKRAIKFKNCCLVLSKNLKFFSNEK